MRIISRYIIKEILPHFILGLLVFTFILLSGTIIELTTILITRGLEYKNLLLIIAYTLPPLLVLTIPMALLLALMVGLGRLSADFEIMIMRNLGISTFRLFLPIFAFAFFCWIASSYFMISLTPKSNNALVNLMYKIMTTRITTEIKPRVFYNEFPNISLYIGDITKEQQWKNIFILYKINEEKTRVILAKNGYAITDDINKKLIISLKNGSWHEDIQAGKYDWARFDYYEIPIKASSFFPPTRTFKSDREMTLSELSAEIKERKQKHMFYNNLQVEWHKKFSIPFACIVFAIVGYIFLHHQLRINKFSGYSISLFIILIYYMLLLLGERLADEAELHPILGAWLSNIVLSLMGIFYIFYKKFNLKFKLFPFFKKNILSKRKKEEPKIIVRIRIPRFSTISSFILDKYLIKQFIKYFSLSSVSFTIIFLIVEAFNLLDDLLRNNVAVSVLWSYIKFYTPNVFYLTIPLSAMTGILIGFSILSRNNEITAIKANGISLYRICLPIIYAGILISLLQFSLQEYILPYTNKVANNLRREIKGLPQISHAFDENNWVFGEKNLLYNYSLFDSSKNTFYRFQILDLDNQTWQLKGRMYSEYAFSYGNLWYLTSTEAVSFEMHRAIYKNYKVLKLVLPEDANYFRTEFKLPDQMSIGELYKYISHLARKGYDVNNLNVDFYNKPSFALAVLIMILIGLPFSFMMGKKGALYGIGISLITGIFYWSFMAFSKSLGYVNLLPPLLAAWLPNIFLSLVAIILLINLRT